MSQNLVNSAIEALDVNDLTQLLERKGVAVVVFTIHDVETAIEAVIEPEDGHVDPDAFLVGAREAIEQAMCDAANRKCDELLLAARPVTPAEQYRLDAAEDDYREHQYDVAIH